MIIIHLAMRISPSLYKRIRHDFTAFYVKKQWREEGSFMTARRMRVPHQALIDPNLSKVAAQVEDTFSSTRYRDALAQEIEIGPTPEERAACECRLAQRLAEFSGSDGCASSDVLPSLMFDPSRLFCRDIAQFAMLTNVCFVVFLNVYLILLVHC